MEEEWGSAETAAAEGEEEKASCCPPPPLLLLSLDASTAEAAEAVLRWSRESLKGDSDIILKAEPGERDCGDLTYDQLSTDHYAHHHSL